MTHRLPFAAVIAASLAALWAVAPGGPPAAGTAEAQAAPATTASALARARGGPRAATVLRGLEAPWEIAFLPDGSALITERPGRVRFMSRRRDPGTQVVGSFRVSNGEGGLLGLAVDPDFNRNRFVYLFLTVDGQAVLLRYRFVRRRLESGVTLVGGIGANRIHDAGRVHFGPDRRLYFTTGDKAAPGTAQDPNSLNGKFLALTPAQYRGGGGRPEIVSLGHRNPQGFDWRPGTRALLATEHGPDGDDELNHIRRGHNFGWPTLRGFERRDGFSAPLAVYNPAIAPSGAAFMSLPGSAWSGSLMFAALRGQHIRRIAFGRAGIIRNQAFFQGSFGRVRTVVEGPDGALYALTSNRDGRGAPRAGDDRLIRIVPPAR